MAHQGSCFCGAVTVEVSGSPRRRWATAIAAPAARGLAVRYGGHIMTNHPPLGLVDVFSATLPTLDFQPAVHVNYAETVLPMKDGLPKLKDFPKEFGGSGEAVPE